MHTVDANQTAKIQMLYKHINTFFSILQAADNADLLFYTDSQKSHSIKVNCALSWTQINPKSFPFRLFCQGFFLWFIRVFPTHYTDYPHPMPNPHSYFVEVVDCS